MRWGSGKKADSDFAREQILDAALRCYQQNTVQKTRMEHVAREAKVSRTTIYRYFQNRDEVLSGVVQRGLHALVNQVRDRVAEKSSFAEFLVEALSVAAELVPSSPVFGLMLGEASSVMTRLDVGSEYFFEASRKLFQHRFEAALANGELRDGITFQEFMDWIIHVAVAYVLAPPPIGDPSSRRHMLWRFLVPSIVRAEVIPLDKH